MFTACTQDTPDNPNRVTKKEFNSELINRLSNYNDSIQNAINPSRRINWGNVIKIAKADACGALDGAVKGITIGSIIPGIGSTEGAIIGGTVIGTLSSLEAYHNLQNGTATQNLSLLDNSNRDKVLTGYNQQQLSPTYLDTEISLLTTVQIDSCAYYVASTHNSILKNYNTYSSSQIETSLSELTADEDALINHTDFIATQTNCVSGIFTTVNSTDMIGVIMSKFVKFFPFSTHSETALKSFVQRYQNEVNQSNELTNQEKLSLNIGFKVMEQSFFFWQSYQEIDHVTEQEFNGSI